MFTITARGIYGLSALIELTPSYNQKSRQIREIANKHNIPQHYLEQILLVLRKAGIVESYRGAHGGYALARHPSQIQVLEVMELLEGKLAVLSGQQKDNTLNFFWNAMEETIRTFLNRDLEDIALEMQAQQQQISYSI
ncbi:MAG: RrF2 family transcriptional regulator [Salinispira sp.]